MSIYAYLLFPDLSLDAQGLDHHKSKIAIHHKNRIIQSSGDAIADGVLPGVTLSMALVLCPKLYIYPYQPDIERRSLHRLAIWAYQYSHQVAIWNKGLCIEVSKSKLLFGDLAEFSQIIKQSAILQKNRVHIAFGYTPEMAALFLKQKVRPREHAFYKTLHQIPIEAINIQDNQKKRLKNMGFRTIGDYFTATSRSRQSRLHQDTYQYLDAVAGRHQTPLTWFTPPAVFNQSIGFIKGLESINMLKFPANRLVQDATNWLNQRQCATTEIRWKLTLEDRTTESLHILLKQAANNTSALSEPTWLKLEKLNLRSSIIEIRLQINHLQQATLTNHDLFTKAHDSDRSQLINRLIARLGSDCITTPCRIQDSRPEYANQLKKCQLSHPLPDIPPRPIWLLDSPKPLGYSLEKAGHVLLQGPERVETGWWDFKPVCRQYWIGTCHHERISWIYEDQHSKIWWLAGWFA